MGIDKILISHAHHDHIGGLQDVLNLLKSRGQSAPKVFKYLDNNKFERQIFEMHQDLNREEILPILDGDKYKIDDDLELQAIYTPGHISDHYSFLLNGNEDSVLFSGDIILGSPSTHVEDLSTYMKTMYMLKENYKFEHVCVPHSLSLDEEGQIMMEGPKKLQEYIKYREDRLQQLETCCNQEQRSKADIYEHLYGQRNL